MAHNNRAAVLGTGQTKYVAKRHDVTMAGMCREAMDAALADAGVSIDEIDAIVAEAVSATGASGMKDMGKVMGVVKPKIGEQAEGGRVAAAVKKALAG